MALKVARSNASGTICPYCGQFHRINEGGSEALLNGEVWFWCEYCRKKSLMDVGVKPARGGLIPWHRPEHVPPGYKRKPPTGKRLRARRR